MLVNDDTIQVTGRVQEVLPGPVFRIRLANGYELLGHLPGRQKGRASEVVVGCEVPLELSAYDLSRGRIALPPGPLGPLGPLGPVGPSVPSGVGRAP